MTSRAVLRRRGLAVAIACGACAGGAIGLSAPLLAVSIDAMTGSGLAVGANAIASALSTLIMAPLVPALFARMPPRRAIAFSVLCGAAALAAFPLTSDLAIWLLLRLVFGLAITVLFCGSEIWINQLAPEAVRARLLGLYASALAGGLAGGAALFGIIGADGPWAFLACAAITALPIGLLSVVRAPRPRRPAASDAHPRQLWTAARLAPVAIIAAIAFGSIETVGLSFLPIYAVRVAYGESGGAVLLIAWAVGNVALQAPIGWLADYWGRRRVLALCALFGVACPTLLVVGPTVLWAASVIVFFYGGVVVGMYAVGLSIISQANPASRIAQANSAFVFAYGVGSLFSPLAAGAALDAFNPNGALYALIGFAGVHLLADRLLKRAGVDRKGLLAP